MIDMAPWSIPTPCCSCGSGFETTSYAGLFFICFFFLIFSCLWATAAAHGNRVPGGVPVDGIRVAGGPPAAPAEDSFHFCTLSVGRIMSGELRVERSAPPT